jgi:hypothetical protein
MHHGLDAYYYYAQASQRLTLNHIKGGKPESSLTKEYGNNASTALLPAAGNDAQFAPRPQLAGAPSRLAHTLHDIID